MRHGLWAASIPLERSVKAMIMKTPPAQAKTVVRAFQIALTTLFVYTQLN